MESFKNTKYYTLRQRITGGESTRFTIAYHIRREYPGDEWDGAWFANANVTGGEYPLEWGTIYDADMSIEDVEADLLDEAIGAIHGEFEGRTSGYSIS